MNEHLNLLWKEKFTIRAYEVGPSGRVTIQSVCNYLQEAAGNHATELGVSIDRLIDQNLTWVLSRFHVKMFSYPFWRQQIRVETWPAAKDTFYAIRDFHLFDDKSKQIGMASSSWMLIDVKARKPLIMPEFMNGIQNPEKGRAIQDSFKRLPKLNSIDFEKHFNVRLSDLDFNQHVNSVNYIEWGLETVPADIWKHFQLREIEVSYRAESIYGDKVISQSYLKKENNKHIFVHRLLKKKDNKELTRMISTWIKI